MGLGSLFSIGAVAGICLLCWFVYGLHYSSFQAVRLLFLLVLFPLWLIGNRAKRFGDEAQALFKFLGKRVPRDFGFVSEALDAHAAWARPGLLQDYQRWQRIGALLGGVAMVGVLGALLFGLRVFQRV
jgi:hypothetical protein